MNPREVIYPKHRLKSETLEILYESEQYSIAAFVWDNEKRIGIRWNKVKESEIGYPKSRNYPTWFILPKKVGALIVDAERTLDHKKGPLAEREPVNRDWGL